MDALRVSKRFDRRAASSINCHAATRFSSQSYNRPCWEAAENQCRAPRRRVLPPSLRSQYFPAKGVWLYVRFPNKDEWSRIWLVVAIVLTVAPVVAGVILATRR